VLEDPPGPSFLAGIQNTFYYGLYSEARGLIGSGQSVAAVTRTLAEARVTLGGVRKQIGEARDHLFLRFAARCLADLDPEVLAPLIEGQWLAEFDPFAVAESVRCPVLLLRADDTQGGKLPREDADRLAAGL